MPKRIGALDGLVHQDLVGDALEAFDEIHEGRRCHLRREGSAFKDASLKPERDRSAFLLASEEVRALVRRLPTFHVAGPAPHPVADEAREDADGPEAAVSLRQESDDDVPHRAGEDAKLLAQAEQGDEGEEDLDGHPLEDARVVRVGAQGRAKGQGPPRIEHVVDAHRISELAYFREGGRRNVQVAPPLTTPVLRLRFDLLLGRGGHVRGSRHIKVADGKDVLVVAKQGQRSGQPAARAARPTVHVPSAFGNAVGQPGRPADGVRFAVGALEGGCEGVGVDDACFDLGHVGEVTVGDPAQPGSNLREGRDVGGGLAGPRELIRREVPPSARVKNFANGALPGSVAAR